MEMSENTVELPEIGGTRAGFPQLWGMAEMTDFANETADRLGKPRLHPGRAWSWDQIADFPTPVARLMGGNVYLADEVRPWIVQRLSAERFKTTPISDAARAAILADRDQMSLRAAATKHDVSTATVHRIWRGVAQ